MCGSTSSPTISRRGRLAVCVGVAVLSGGLGCATARPDVEPYAPPGRPAALRLLDAAEGVAFQVPRGVERIDALATTAHEWALRGRPARTRPLVRRALREASRNVESLTSDSLGVLAVAAGDAGACGSLHGLVQRLGEGFESAVLPYAASGCDAQMQGGLNAIDDGGFAYGLLGVQRALSLALDEAATGQDDVLERLTMRAMRVDPAPARIVALAAVGSLYRARGGVELADRLAGEAWHLLRRATLEPGQAARALTAIAPHAPALGAVPAVARLAGQRAEAGDLSTALSVADSLVASGRADVAAELMIDFVVPRMADDPDLSPATVGGVLAAAGRHAPARAAFQRALDWAAGSEARQAAVARAAADAGMVEVVRAELETSPPGPVADRMRRSLVEAMLTRGQPRAAERSAEAITTPPWRRAAWRAIAVAYADGGDAEAARRVLEHARRDLEATPPTGAGEADAELADTALAWGRAGAPVMGLSILRSTMPARELHRALVGLVPSIDRLASDADEVSAILDALQLGSGR